MDGNLLSMVFRISLTAFFLTVTPALACGGNKVCRLEGANGGTYYLSKPKNSASSASRRLFVFFHGHNGSGARLIENRSLVRTLHKGGFVLVAPDGPAFVSNGRTTRGWAARPEGDAPRGGRSDIAFVERVLRRVARDHDIDLRHTVVGGFSSGGSMAWYFGCYSTMPLAGIVAVAGTLRRPMPERFTTSPDGAKETMCPGPPRKLIHIHGFSDRQVPLEGRQIRSWHQGDVFEGLATMRRTNGCNTRPDRISIKQSYWCRDWDRCKSDVPLRLCLHQGGHGLPRNWLSLGLEWIK